MVSLLDVILLFVIFACWLAVVTIWIVNGLSRQLSRLHWLPGFVLSILVGKLAFDHLMPSLSLCLAVTAVGPLVAISAIYFGDEIGSMLRIHIIRMKDATNNNL